MKSNSFCESKERNKRKPKSMSLLQNPTYEVERRDKDKAVGLVISTA